MSVDDAGAAARNDAAQGACLREDVLEIEARELLLRPEEFAILVQLARGLPRVLFLGYGETDEWAHSGRYDMYLRGARQFGVVRVTRISIRG